MANVIRKATNRFTKGLIMDFSPENTKNEVLTQALNATLLTFNGNELSLQNDMGNARVETAFLPDGYIPVGTCEYGGIIYIVSYNPLEDKSLIGCFPSPERNISNNELGISDVQIDREFFQKFTNGFPDPNGAILHNTLYVLLKNDNLNPGDKFLVCANKDIYNEKIVDLLIDKDDKHYVGNLSNNPKGYEPVSNPIIALNVVSIEDSGKIVYLNSDIRQYEISNSYNINGLQYTDTYKYHILGQMAENNGVYNLATIDPDDYRNVLSSGYSVFKSKTSGRLAILAELVMIDSYSVTHSIYPRKDEFGNIIEGIFDIIIHTEIEPLLNQNNYYTAPKLLYYYLDNSLGYIQTKNDSKRPLFRIENGINTGKYNDTFFQTYLNDIYEPIDNNITKKLNTTLNYSGKFNFPKPYTYHGRMNPYYGEITGTTDFTIYTKFTEGKYHRINYSQISKNADIIKYYKEDIRAKFYYYEPSGEEYSLYTETEINPSYTYYIRKPNYTYTDVKRDTKYYNEPLYKLITIPMLADISLINNTLIEKFQYLEIHSYKKASENDIYNSDKLYYTEDGGLTYIQLTGKPEIGVTYYILIIETSLVSIGYIVDVNTVMGTVYYFPNEKIYIQASEEDKRKYYDFVTYPYEPTKPYGSPITLYLLENDWEYIEATENEIYNRKELGIDLYYSTNYVLIQEIEYYKKSNLLFIVVPMDTYVDSSKFTPNVSYNWIYGKDKPVGDYPKDDEIYLYTLADFIPDNLNTDNDNYLTYGDIRLGNIQLPTVVSLNGLDLPFKYDYTIVPCMNYGKLQHLAVSNTIDFSKLHAFNLSKFNVWKYRIDGNQLRLTFGAEIFDTYETDKVDSLILEFYDLWGFAGSIEITDKKSYSGIFTKLIPLNSLKALSRKKVTANGYSEEYVRNINIKEKVDNNGNIIKGEFVFNSEPAVYQNSINGWNLTSKSLSDSEEKSDYNDCGTLYSNVVYGVKTYLRRSTKNGKEFIKKENFFLYTLPIYNDFYYTISDFSNLQEPEIDLMLTYKLKDSSTRYVYTLNGLTNGLNEEDNNKVTNYLSGFYDETSLELIKYYIYKGCTDVYLEIGLKKDYEDLNLSYDPNINNYFSCTLKLVSDSDASKTYTVSSNADGLIGDSQILNYNNGSINIDENVNKLGFKYGNTIIIPNTTFKNANFITSLGSSPIQINYEFVVGYQANILDIRNTQVLATTVCALCHKKPDGEYNYEDFGVYVLSENGQSKYLSNVMFYNEGTKEKEVFGVCKQIKTSGTNMLEECQSITSVETDALEIKTAGKLNTGDPLKQLVSNIGKLTFCQPHAHGLSELNGVNIHEGDAYIKHYGIPPELGGMTIDTDTGSDNELDQCYGINPRTFLFEHPKYNLSLNTKNTINYYSEFLSTLDYSTITGQMRADALEEGDRAWINTTMREYTGFTGLELSDFNLKMIETMKYIYAYNPDYDSLNVNVGNINVQNYDPSFISNLLSIDSKLIFEKNQTLNDFIYIGPIKFSNYLQYLNIYSESSDGSKIDTELTDMFGETKYLPLLLFIPNYLYCGLEKSNYLISNLTYNTPVPKELELELEFSASNLTVIKHSNGENTFLNGVPNKKSLYGYNLEFNKMIELDVSNYTIDIDGKLKINSDGAKEIKSSELLINSDLNLKLYNSSYSFPYTFTNNNGENVELNLTLHLNKYGTAFSDFKCGKDSFIVGGEVSSIADSMLYTIEPYITVSNLGNKENYTFSAQVTELELQGTCQILNDKIPIYGSSISLSNLSYETLQSLAGTNNSPITLLKNDGSTITDYPFNYRVDTSNRTISANDTAVNNYLYSNILVKDGEIKINTEFNLINTENDYEYLVVLLELKINKIKYNVILTSKLETNPAAFMSTTKTTNYYTKAREYKVLDIYKKSRLRGSSITINDLVYEPSVEGHRLFIRNNCCVYNPALRGKIYYRFLNGGNDAGHDSWDYDTKYYNNIFIFTGPSYIKENLYND